MSPLRIAAQYTATSLISYVDSPFFHPQQSKPRVMFVERDSIPLAIVDWTKGRLLTQDELARDLNQGIWRK